MASAGLAATSVLLTLIITAETTTATRAKIAAVRNP